MKELLQKRLEELNRDEGGAVFLMMLAGVMILFMFSLILYDTGKAVNHKVDVNMAADTAAYSQAAVEARAMNMIAFANIGKRTIVGIHNMYYFQYPMYLAWWLGQCSKCCCGWYCGCWTECFNCFGNAIDGSPFAELGDWLDFLGDDNLEKNLKDLDSFQADLKDNVAYWSAGEAMVRGVRNGAHMVLTYPKPDNSTYGPLPLKRGDPSESCLTPTPLADNPVTLVTLIEWQANFQNLKNRSTSSPNIASEGPAERVNIAYSFLACPLVTPDDGAPFYNDADGNNGEDWLKTSNYVYAYRHTPDIGRKLRDNYNFMSEDYTRSGSVTMPETGSWSFARSEFYFPPSNKPDTLLKDGAHDMWMFHPGWFGRMRPMTLPYEELPVEHREMFQDALPLGMGLAMSLFNISGVPNFDSSGFSTDVQYMLMNVTPGMGGTINEAATGADRHVTDGLSK